MRGAERQLLQISRIMGKPPLRVSYVAIVAEKWVRLNCIYGRFGEDVYFRARC